LKNIKVEVRDEKVFIIDENDKSLECTCKEDIKWALLSVSAGNLIKLFATWDGQHLTPLSVLLNRRFIKLDQT